jgi:hypothetical protein
MARRWTVNPPMGQVIGGWVGAMIVLGIAGGWLFGPAEVTLHTVPMAPRPPVTATPAGSSGPSEIDAERAADRRGEHGDGHGNEHGNEHGNGHGNSRGAVDRSDRGQPGGEVSERR